VRGVVRDGHPYRDGFWEHYHGLLARMSHSPERFSIPTRGDS